MDKILKKYDEYIAKGEIENALKSLLYWKEEFTLNNNLSSLFTILNELEGFYRKQHKKDECFNILEEIKTIMNKLEINDTMSAVIPYINIATGYSAFSEFEKSLEYFEKAKYILDTKNDGCIDCKYQYAPLYNNMATTLSYLKRYDEAVECCEKAIKINEEIPNGKINSAVTYLNIANIIEVKEGKDNSKNEIDKQLNFAKDILEDINIRRDMYYLFTLDKCINTFKYYGDIEYADILIKRKHTIGEALK